MMSKRAKTVDGKEVEVERTKREEKKRMKRQVDREQEGKKGQERESGYRRGSRRVHVNGS